jgi:hypothetical protein
VAKRGSRIGSGKKRNPAPEVHEKRAREDLQSSELWLKEAKRGKSERAVLRHGLAAYGDAVESIREAGYGGVPDLRRRGYEMKKESEAILARRTAKNPSQKRHGEAADEWRILYEFAMVRADRSRSPEARLGHLLDAIKHAAMMQAERENAADDRGARAAGRMGERSIGLVQKMFRSKNPADIPGGSMSACIAIMETRPDVESAGALCNWLAQRAGEFGPGIKSFGRSKKKLDPESKRALGKLMRGT